MLVSGRVFILFLGRWKPTKFRVFIQTTTKMRPPKRDVDPLREKISR